MARCSPPLLRRFFCCAAKSASATSAAAGTKKKNIVFLGSPQVRPPANSQRLVQCLIRGFGSHLRWLPRSWTRCWPRPAPPIPHSRSLPSWRSRRPPRTGGGSCCRRPSRSSRSSVGSLATSSSPPSALGRCFLQNRSPSLLHIEAIVVQLIVVCLAMQESFLSDLKGVKPELCITAAYGNILPQRFLDIPPCGKSRNLSVKLPALPLF